MNRSRIFRATPLSRNAAWLFCTLLIVGCGIEPETLQKLQEAANEVSTSAAAQPSETALVAAETEPYQPLFPERVDPFRFPSSALADGESSGDAAEAADRYRVLGFADVDEPRVLMQIQDEVFSLRVGQFIRGLEIVEIQPPQVRLRSGDLTWTATMFDRRSE